MRYPQEAVLFRVLDPNGSPFSVGTVVEFSRIYDQHDLRRPQDSAVLAVTAAYKEDVAGYLYDVEYIFGTSLLQPLTAAAYELIESLGFTREIDDAILFWLKQDEKLSTDAGDSVMIPAGTLLELRNNGDFGTRELLVVGDAYNEKNCPDYPDGGWVIDRERLEPATPAAQAFLDSLDGDEE